MRVLLIAGLLLSVPACKTFFPPRKPLPTRAEFRKQVLGLTPAEVKEKLGKPGWTSETAKGEPSNWTYEMCSFNPTTDKTDVFAQIVFRGGKVDEINFAP